MVSFKQLYIGGKWTDSDGDSVLTVINVDEFLNTKSVIWSAR